MSSVGIYEKASTQFDGTTPLESHVSYMKIGQDASANFPLRQFKTINSPTDVMIQFFYKRETPRFQRDASEQVQFLALEEGVACFFVSETSIQCDTPQRHRLLATYDMTYSQRWLHFTLAINKKGSAYLQIRSGLDVIASDAFDKQNAQFQFSHTSTAKPSLCIGLCFPDMRGADSGFSGDLREVYVAETYTADPKDQIHVVRTYNLDLLGYYRLFDAKEHFSSNEVELINNTQYNNFKKADIAVDVCPWTHQVERFVKLDGQDLSILPSEHKGNFKEQGYGYSMSLTFMIDRDHCYTQNVSEAEDGCNLVYLDGVFILYMTRPNRARFHFYAWKNYFETQTSQLFVPFNEWVTLQMTMDHYRGYLIVMLDHNGEVTNTLQNRNNFERQKPGQFLQLFSGTAAIVSHFQLADVAFSLPVKRSQFKDPLYNIDFKNQQSTVIPNSGSSEDLILETPAVLASTLYEHVEYGELQTKSFFAKHLAFDGVTCTDSHNTVLLERNAPNLVVKLESELPKTVQFWFKLFDKADFYPGKVSNTQIVFFQIESLQNLGNPVWEVFLNDAFAQVDSVGSQTIQRTLKIAPFGRKTTESLNTVLSFPEFKLDNEDEFGWWHLSCTLTAEQSECYLSNRNLSVNRTGHSEETLMGFYKTVSSAKFVSNLKQLMVKEVQLYSEVLTEEQIAYSRYHRGVYKESLIISTSFKNLTQLLVDDHTTKAVLKYEPTTKKLQLSTEKNYHALCPPLTYLLGDRCFSEPVNEVVLTVFPRWDQDVTDLVWTFSLEHSNLIALENDRSQIGLQVQLLSDDPTLDEILFYQSYQDPTRWSFDVQSQWMRHEGQYQITAIVSNSQFYDQKQITFIPKKCQWFQIKDSDAWSAMQTVSQAPGEADVTFSVESYFLPVVGCDKYFNFYDEFDEAGFHFKFIIANSDNEYFVDQPEVQWTFRYAENHHVNSLAGIGVTIPASEQHKLPIWTDVKILMKIEWQSREFNSTTSNQEDTVFQHLMYTLRFEPQSIQVDAQIEANRNILIAGQTLELHSVSTLIGVDSQLAQKFLRFKWTCPANFAPLCKNQEDQPSLFLPYSDVKNVMQIIYEYKYNFELLVTLETPSGEILEGRNSIYAQWYSETQIPDFKVSCEPEPIELLSEDTMTCRVQAKDFDAESVLDQFMISWLITPEVELTQSDGDMFYVPAGELAEETSYMVVVTMAIKDSSYWVPSAQFSHTFQTGSLEDEYDQLFDMEEQEATLEVEETESEGGRRRLQQSGKSVDEIVELLEHQQFDDTEFYYSSTTYDYCHDLIAAYMQEPNTEAMLQAFDSLNEKTNKHHKADAIIIMQLLKAIAENAHHNENQTEIDSVLERLLLMPYDVAFATNEFEVTSQVFNYASAQKNDEFFLQALDTMFYFTADNIYGQLPSKPLSDLYLRLTVILNINDEPEVVIQLFDSGTDEVYEVSDLSGQARLSFRVNHRTYVNGQTVCQVNSDDDWSSEMCETKFVEADMIVNCTCNMMAGRKLGLIRDSTLEEIPSRLFQVSRQGDSAEYTLIGSLLVLVIFVIHFLLAVGQFVAYKLDTQDCSQSESSNEVSLMVRGVAQEQGCSVEKAQTKAKDIKYFMGSTNLSLYTCIALHPLTSPFLFYDALRPRLMRFATWQFWIVVFELDCLAYFNQIAFDPDQPLLLTAQDVAMLLWEVLLGALLLLPLFQNFLLCCMSDHFDTKQNCVKASHGSRRLRPIMLIFTNLMSLLPPFLAGTYCALNGGKAEFLACVAICFGLLAGIFGYNLLYVLVNIGLPQSFNWVKSSLTIELQQHFTAVRKCMLNPNVYKGSEVLSTERDFQTEMCEAPPPVATEQKLKYSIHCVMEQTPKESAHRDA